jgi:hypothetical protein
MCLTKYTLYGYRTGIYYMRTIKPVPADLLLVEGHEEGIMC